MAYIVALINRERTKLNRIIKRNLRDSVNPFEISENLFIRQYRFPQTITIRLIDEIRPFVRNIGDVPLELQILCVLYFFASGSYQIRVGADAFSALSQPMVSRYISKYTDIIFYHLSSTYIKFPQTAAAIENTKASFRRRYNVPGILGIIDGTHVAVSSLSHEVEHAFMNRKGFHSINLQIACNQDMLITNINARYPGSTHDSYIFLGSRLYAFLNNLYNQNQNEMNFLIGDSGYPLLPFLMNIVQGENLTPAEENFNRIILSVRHLIERTIGVLKIRFRCILGERQPRYNQSKVSRIIYACATLHNFLLINRFNILHDIDDDHLGDLIDNERALHINPPANRVSGVTRRNELIRMLMQN